jgi:hypothetical protein
MTVNRNSTIPDLLNPAKNGVFIHHYDANGKSWSSIGSQPGGYFESVGIIDEPLNTAPSDKIWKLRFSCRLYDADGNFITVENGEMVGPIWPR